MADLYTLGGYTFESNPFEMDIPESKKTVAEVKTYSGSALFQWDAILVGQSITLSWPSMSQAMYDQLRILYLSTDEVSFSPNDSLVYQVIVTDLTGEYVQYWIESLQYRKNVDLTLNIRNSTAS